MSRDDAAETFSYPAKIEYLMGLALSGPPGAAHISCEVTGTAVRLLAAVFAAADTHLCIQAVSEYRTDVPNAWSHQRRVPAVSGASLWFWSATRSNTRRNPGIRHGKTPERPFRQTSTPIILKDRFG